MRERVAVSVRVALSLFVLIAIGLVSEAGLRWN
jgi:hypothetical protein